MAHRRCARTALWHVDLPENTARAIEARVSGDAVLVTGATGFIGGALVRHLRDQGVEVAGVDLRGDGADVLAADVACPETFGALLDRVQTIVHTAALVTNALDDAAMWRANVLATRNLVAAAVERGLRRFVHVSSIVVYGNVAVGELDEEHPVHAHGGSYVLTKLAAEHAVLAAHAQHGLEVVIVRPGDVYGPGSRPWVVEPIEMIKRRQFLLPANGEGCFRPVYVDDVVRGIAAASRAPQAAGQIVNLASDGWVPTREFFAYHHRWLGRFGPLCVPTGIAWALAESTFRAQRLFGVRSEGSGASVLQLASRAWFSIRKAGALLGWKPEVALDEGMQRSERWARERGLL
jgi:nucleoside-diphosphate-sugar epimerase